MCFGTSSGKSCYDHFSWKLWEHDRDQRFWRKNRNKEIVFSHCFLVDKQLPLLKRLKIGTRNHPKKWHVVNRWHGQVLDSIPVKIVSSTDPVREEKAKAIVSK